MNAIRLPVEPLIAWMQRHGYHVGYGWRSGANQFVGASMNGWSESNQQAFYRAQRQGWISATKADAIACEELGLHPFFIWGPDWYDVFERETA